MWLHLDTSAFVKLVVHEQGSAEVATVWENADRLISSVVLYPEAGAAIGRARRMGRIRRHSVSSAWRRIEALWAVVDRFDLSEPLARLAGELAERHGLRSCDAVHLASAGLRRRRRARTRCSRWRPARGQPPPRARHGSPAVTGVGARLLFVPAFFGSAARVVPGR